MSSAVVGDREIVKIQSIRESRHEPARVGARVISSGGAIARAGDVSVRTA